MSGLLSLFGFRRGSGGGSRADSRTATQQGSGWSVLQEEDSEVYKMGHSIVERVRTALFQTDGSGRQGKTVCAEGVEEVKQSEGPSTTDELRPAEDSDMAVEADSGVTAAAAAAAQSGDVGGSGGGVVDEDAAAPVPQIGPPAPRIAINAEELTRQGNKLRQARRKRSAEAKADEAEASTTTLRRSGRRSSTSSRHSAEGDSAEAPVAAGGGHGDAASNVGAEPSIAASAATAAVEDVVGEGSAPRLLSGLTPADLAGVQLRKVVKETKVTTVRFVKEVVEREDGGEEQEQADQVEEGESEAPVEGAANLKDYGTAAEAEAEAAVAMEEEAEELPQEQEEVPLRRGRRSRAVKSTDLREVKLRSTKRKSKDEVVEGESTEEAAAAEGKSPARGAGRRRGGKRAKIDADGYDLRTHLQTSLVTKFAKAAPPPSPAASTSSNVTFGSPEPQPRKPRVTRQSARKQRELRIKEQEQAGV